MGEGGMSQKVKKVRDDTLTPFLALTPKLRLNNCVFV